MNPNPTRASIFIARVLLLMREGADKVASRVGRLRWLPLLAAAVMFGAALPAAEAATLYVSKIALDKSPNAADQPADDAPLNFYCGEGYDRLSSESDALRSAPAWPLHACAEDRLLSHAADKIRVVYVEWQNTSACTKSAEVIVQIKEDKRRTALAQGVANLVKAGVDKVNVLDEPADQQKPTLMLCFTPFEQALNYDRATADLSVSLKSSQAEKVHKQIITGPPEHWFLSADAIVKGAKELKYDSDKKAVFQRDKPEQLYLGINWMLGDVYSRYGNLAKERLVGKVMLLPSRHPFDSVGVGIAYRFADGVFNTESGLQTTGGFMVFAGHFWTKNDGVDANGNPTQDGRSRSWRLGVSYGLDSLVGWLK